MSCTTSSFTKLLMAFQNFGISWMICMQRKAISNIDARIQHKQITLYIQLLEDHGTRLGENITKHLEEDIWELRPGNNRALYFFYKDDTYVLLHQFRKKTQKTPRREIEKAKAERDDWITRKG